MANKFCVSLSCAKDNTDKATVAFVVANAAVGSGKETLVFLSVEAVRLSQKGYADDIREEGFAPLKELMENFAKAGGTMYVCSPCFKKRKLDENGLVRRRGPRLRQRPPAPDPAAHRPAHARAAPRVPLHRDLGGGRLPGLVPHDRQRAGLPGAARPGA
jgi:uncharacterized protein